MTCCWSSTFILVFLLLSCSFSLRNTSELHIRNWLISIPNISFENSLDTPKTGIVHSNAPISSSVESFKIYISLFFGINEVNKYHNGSSIIFTHHKRRKWSHARIAFYNNTTATFNFPQKSGDIEKNPGPSNNVNKKPSNNITQSSINNHGNNGNSVNRIPVHISSRIHNDSHWSMLNKQNTCYSNLITVHGLLLFLLQNHVEQLIFVS